MRRLIVGLVAAVLLAPVAAGAQTSPSPEQTNAARTCKALRASIGGAAFNAAFGKNANDRNAYGKCVSKLANVEQENTSSANTSCRAEQNDPNFASTHGGKTFDEFYGTNANGKNSFGSCVSQKSQASSETEETALNPAKACAALRSQMGTAVFALLYGKNGNKRNAFGKCVSSLARTQVAQLANTSQQCSAEQGDAGFAAAHDGKTFDQFYGTNDTDANAFGKCVAQKTSTATTAVEQSRVAAAKSCKAELTADRAVFMRKYGKNRNLSNAFGKCVSAKARANR